MTSRSDVLREVMLETGTTQSDLSRLSGVRQPSISGFLSGKVDLSDDQLDRLLSCMGFRLEVVRRPVVPKRSPVAPTPTKPAFRAAAQPADHDAGPRGPAPCARAGPSTRKVGAVGCGSAKPVAA